VNIRGVRSPQTRLVRQRLAVILDPLEGNTSIEKVLFIGQSSVFPLILPLCQRLRNLRDAYITGGDNGEVREIEHVNEPLSTTAVQAIITDCLLSSVPLNVIRFEGVAIIDERAIELFCRGIRSTTVERLELGRCFVSDGTALARAITESRIKSLSFRDLCSGSVSEYQRQLDNFVAALVAGLPAMARLEAIELALADMFFDSEQLDIEENEDGGANNVTSIIRAAGSCPYLKHLEVHLPTSREPVSYSLRELYAAVVECIQCSSSLENVKVIRVEQDIPDDVTSAFVSVLQNNYTLKQFEVTPIGGSELSSKWTTIQRHGSIICRLNEAGRSYEKQDPNNLQKGWQVLEQVLCDVDCIYLHLKNHPSLLSYTDICLPVSSPGTKRKRGQE
jgi:hypothetical protein